MKKVVSGTLAAAIAISPISALPGTEVNATENSSILATTEEKRKEAVDVNVEDTEKIEVSKAEEVSNIPKVEEKSEDKGNQKVEEKPENNKEIEGEEVNKQVKLEQVKVTGKLEFDISLPMPIINSDKIDMEIALNKEGARIGSISVGGLESGNLSGDTVYEVKKLNSKREVLKEDENDIYFLHIIVSNLELGNYNASIAGGGYVSTNVDNIEIVEYSKRIKLGTRDNIISNNGSDREEYSGSFLVGDVNSDNKIDMSDYTLVFENLGSKNSKYDLNRDGFVDIADLTYVNENIGKTQKEVEVINLEGIINPDTIQVDTNNIKVGEGDNIKDLFINSEKTVVIGRVDGNAPSKENPLVLEIDLANSSRNGDKAINMDSIAIKSSEGSVNSEAGAPSEGSITYMDVNGVSKTVQFGGNAKATLKTSENGDIIVDLGSQVAVKQISISVTGNRGNKKISEIAKIEFLNNVYKEIPKPDMNIPNMKTVETSTNLHDERITLTWEPQPNITSYEVKYEKLDSNGTVTKTKKLQTNKSSINILDKDIKPYDLYRVSIQSLNGDWKSGYELETGSTGTTGHKAFDGKADNVDKNFIPIESFYDGEIGTVAEIQVIPIQAPQEPINIITEQDYRSFTLKWENHIQARDFDIYYRKVGDTNKKWIKANENKIEVEENSPAVTNPNKNYLVRAHSYTVNGLEDKAIYEVRVTATNHLGTSKMSKTYIASTESLEPPVSSNYKLINRSTEDGEIGTENIIDVLNTNVSISTVDGKYAVVDNNYGTTWVLNDWDSGIYSDRGPTITFNKEYEMDTITLVPNLQKGYPSGLNQVEIHVWDEEGQQKTVAPKNITYKTSNGKTYAILKLDEAVNAKKIQINPSVTRGKVSISELKFYEYDSIEKDIEDLYVDSLRLVIKEGVTQEKIDTLVERVNTKDPISDEYHPNKEILEKELDTAQKLFNDQKVSDNIVKLDAAIRNDNVGPSLGMSNDWQSLGAVVRSGRNEDGTNKQMVVYMGSNNPNAQVEITFLQNYGLPSQYQAGTTVVKPGRTEITIPSIISADVEKGGVVMARVKNGANTDNIQLRLSGISEIPHLNVNNFISDTTKIDETKELIRSYIKNLKTHVSELPNLYPKEVSDTDKLDNIYLYEPTTSVLNSTDIEGDRFTLTLPASQILKGIESGLGGNEDAEVERVYNALLAWEQEVQVAYSKKGVYESAQDFNKNGQIDKEETDFFNKNKAPLNRINIKYQRMVMGAAAYASGHHVGVGYGTAQGLIQGVPYKFDKNNEPTNLGEAKLYGTLIGHEMGHVMDIGNRIYPETSNNLLAAITETMDDSNSPLTSGAMTELYKKVTSNTQGLSTNRSIVLGMLWQPHLAYENESTYKMLFNNNDSDMDNDSYFAKLNRAYRDMTDEEKKDGDRDQWLIRMSSKVVGKDLSTFYISHGIVPNATTLQYVSQFIKEDKPIQYINDEARRMRMAGTAKMSEDTTLTASFGSDKMDEPIVDKAYVNQKEVPFELSVDKDSDRILGYEIYRNGQPVGFVERDKNNSVTKYNDVIDSVNNRVFEYKAVAYDYDLNKTNEVELGTIKVRHDGGVVKSSISLKTNTIDKDEANNDIHGSNPNVGLKDMLDDDLTTSYEGRKLSKSEYNSAIHGQEMNPNSDPYVIMDANEIRSLAGIKYTAPTTESGFIFKKSKLAKTSIDKYKIEVSTDGTSWTKVNEGRFNLSGNNPTETIYFDKEGVEGGKQLNVYNARYVKVTAVGAKEISIAELELLSPPGDNIEIGVSDNNKDYKNGSGMLKEDYIYQLDDENTSDVNEMRVIPKGSIIITGEYRGNPAFNVPLVLNQNEEHIADKYNGILMAEIPTEGNLEEISKGNWVYWVEPEDATTFMADNKEIFAELYRTDSVDASKGGQRLVSNTFKLTVLDALPEISLNSVSRSKSGSNVKITEIDKNILNEITNKR